MCHFRFPQTISLERYGIENYFPQHVLEKVFGTNLSAFFPIPDSISVIERLSNECKRWKQLLKKLIAGMLGLPKLSLGEPLYSKSRNAESAQWLCLSDLNGTDLFKIINEIAEKANQLAED